jgi:two-component system cell cycle response regulator
MSFVLVNLLCFGAVNHLNRLRRLEYASLIYHQHLEGELRASETQYRELVEGANSVILRFDTKGIIRFINNYGLRFFGFEPDQLVGHNIVGTIAPRTEQWEDGLGALMRDVQQHPERYLLVEAENVRKNGEPIWLTWSNRPILNEKGELAEILSVGHDISQRKELEAELRKLATTDPLTGIANRRRFLDKAPKEVTRSQRYGRDLSVLMLDVDRFKAINDRYGHAVGDQVLCRLVEVCKDALREHDIIGRLGGEEFAILLPETALDTARTVAERLRKNIETTTVDGESVHFTVSFGVAQVKGSDETAEEVIRRADEALYRAKRSGRNRVEVSS